MRFSVVVSAAALSMALSLPASAGPLSTLLAHLNNPITVSSLLGVTKPTSTSVGGAYSSSSAQPANPVISTDGNSLVAGSTAAAHGNTTYGAPGSFSFGPANVVSGSTSTGAYATNGGTATGTAVSVVLTTTGTTP